MSGFSRVPVALLSATLFLAYADRAVSVATAPVLGDRFGLADAELGFLNGAALIVPFALASLAFGLGRWRLQTGKVMAGCVVVWTSAAAVFALAPTYEQLVVGRMLMGVGQAALLPAAVAAMGLASASGRLSWLTVGSALGRSGGLLTVGALLAIATSGVAAFLPVAAWRVSALVMVAPNLVVAVLLWRIGYGRVDALEADLDGYVETGSPLWALSYDARSVQSRQGTLGLRYERSMARPDGRWTPGARVEWTHEFGDADAQTLRYADWLEGPGFSIGQDGWDRSRLNLGLSLGWTGSNGWAWTTEYEGGFSDGEIMNGLRLKLLKIF